MIRDWRISEHPSPAPLGEPFYACKAYMTVFCVLESLAMGRLTDSELRALAASYHGAMFEAQLEIQRRESL